MPNYLYRCKACKSERDEFHRIADAPEFVCIECGTAMVKVPCLFGMAHGKTNDDGRRIDHAKRRMDMKNDLEHNYGVEGVNPVGKNTFESVYSDVKKSGGLVREQMAESAEKNTATKAAKQREWKKGANIRAPKKSREIVERRKAEASADRAIRL